MTDPGKVRLAVVGVGNMGQHHARSIVTLPNAELVAVCDIDHNRADTCAAEHGVDAYYTHQDLLEAVSLDGIIIATPHYDHVPITLDAFKQGIHVLVEKPIAVHAKDVRKMTDAYEASRADKPDLVFSAMFMQRTYGHWQKIKAMIDDGELGQLVRTTWIITNWFRTQAYYDSGGWRATWRGEGGGVLLNQCPHNLDLYQWLVGMPERVTGFATLGKYHTIEVEDEVTAYFDHPDGMVGHFITTTAESPGTNRLEIVGENGRLVFENDKLTFSRNQISMFQHIRESKEGFAKVPFQDIDVPFQTHSQPGHERIIENFARAILHGEPLIAPAVEGYHSVALGNAIMLSAWDGQTIQMSFDEDLYEKKLLDMVSTSRFTKPTVESDNSPADLSQSY